MVCDLNYLRILVMLCSKCSAPELVAGSNLRTGKAQRHQIPSSVVAVVANVATVPFLKARPWM